MNRLTGIFISLFFLSVFSYSAFASELSTALVPYKGRVSVSKETLRTLAGSGNWQLVTDLIAEEVQNLLGGHWEPVAVKFDMNSKKGSPAYYKKSVVYLCPKVWSEVFDAGYMTEKELVDSVFVVLAHELTHAWQDQNTTLLRHKKLTPLFEGHAVFVQSVIANLTGLSDINKKGISIQTDINYWLWQYSSPEEALSKMQENNYTRFEGAKFFFYQYMKGGMRLVNHIVKNPPDSQMLEFFIKNPELF